MASYGAGCCLIVQIFQRGQSAWSLTDKPRALSASTGLPCRTASKILEVLSLFLMMIVELVLKSGSAVVISTNPTSISAVSTPLPGFDKHRHIPHSDLQF